MEVGAGREGGRGPQKSVFLSGLGGLRGPESGEKKTHSADSPLFGGARALGFLRPGQWGGCLWGFGGRRVRPLLRRGLKELMGGRDLLLPDPLGRLVPRRWKLKAGREESGMLGTACVPVPGVRGDPGSGAGARVALWFRQRGFLGPGPLAVVGGQGADGLGRSVAPLARARGSSIPQLWSAGQLRWGCGWWGAGRRLGCYSRRGGFFPSPALPTIIFALLQAVRGWQPRPAPFCSGKDRNSIDQ